MSKSVSDQIASSFKQLPADEQLRLLGRLAHEVKEAVQNRNDKLDEQLAAMASDPQTQSELQSIEREFSRAESDGLEN